MHIAPLRTKLEDFAGTLLSAMDGNPNDFAATRRGLILAPLIAALPAALLVHSATRSIQRKRKSPYLINISGNPRCPTRLRSQSRQCRCSGRPTSPGHMWC